MNDVDRIRTVHVVLDYIVVAARSVPFLCALVDGYLLEGNATQCIQAIGLAPCFGAFGLCWPRVSLPNGYLLAIVEFS